MEKINEFAGCLAGLNFLIGSSDAHGKNFSYLHTASGYNSVFYGRNHIQNIFYLTIFI